MAGSKKNEAKSEMFYCWVKLRNIDVWECKGPLECEKGTGRGGSCFGMHVKKHSGRINKK